MSFCLQLFSFTFNQAKCKILTTLVLDQYVLDKESCLHLGLQALHDKLVAIEWDIIINLLCKSRDHYLC